MSFWQRINPFSKSTGKGDISLKLLNEFYMDAFDGETSLNGWGEIKDYQKVNTLMIQKRSLQLYRENPIANIILNMLTKYVVNKGLTLDSQPDNTILKLDDDELSEIRSNIESHWKLFAKRKISKDRQDNINVLAKKMFLTTLVSGDAVFSIELDRENMPIITVVDGLYIGSSFVADDNVSDGIRFDVNTGEHKEYFIRSINNQSIKVKTKKGRIKAWLIKSHNTLRVNDNRGMPILAPVMETIVQIGKGLDAETKAMAINATFAMIHLKAQEQNNRPDNFLGPDDDKVTDSKGNVYSTKKFANGKMLYNLNPGERVESLSTTRPNVNVIEFTNQLTDIIYTCCGSAPEKAKMKYGSNYSASRQANLDCVAHIDDITKSFSDSFMQPIYDKWLDNMVLLGRLKIPIYLKALIENDIDILDAFRNAEWRGSYDVNIDVLKQAKANELAINNGLMTREEVAKRYHMTDFQTNVKTLEKENAKLMQVQTIPYQELPPQTTEQEDNINDIDNE